MKGRFLVLFFFLISINLYALPGFIIHQGYMTNENGTPVNGIISMTIAIYGSPDGNDILFEQAMDVSVIDGFYTAEINDGAIMPVFDVDKTLYLEVSVNGNKGKPRQKIGAVPYAFYAAKAYDVIGDIHPKSVYINGTKVIDETGKYLGTIDAVKSITAGKGLKGGTITTTGTIELNDDYLSGAAYDGRFINNDEAESISTSMLKNNAVISSKISDGSILLRHINNNNCSHGQIMKYNSATGWECASDLNNSYTAGIGLNLTGNTFSVNFAGSGLANTVARSDHDHNNVYALLTHNHHGIYAPILHNHDGVYSPINHNHDSEYVNVKGDTMTGLLNIQINSAIETPIALTTSNGSVLFEGPQGITPTKGAGIRLMWVPNKRALRVGEVSKNQWDDPNIGYHSYAMGYDTMLKGNYSFSIGNNNEIVGQDNFVFGNYNFSEGSKVTIIGHNNNSFASGEGVFAIGMEHDLNGKEVYTLGYSNNLNGKRNMVIGSDNFVDQQSNDSIIIGNESSIKGSSHAFAIGNYVSASADYAITIGEGISPSQPLDNSRSHSLMIGFNSMMPTLYVGPSSGGMSTGEVGIGTDNPTTKLDVDGGVRTRPQKMLIDSVVSNPLNKEILLKPEIKCSFANRGEMRLFEIPTTIGIEEYFCICKKEVLSINYSWHCIK
ncbi:MAG: hypothetical protein N2746_03605 [Deltaproteobacteria bacterium]|nr:hypothetical protein [Deltaproteobacteria bacterium]